MSKCRTNTVLSKWFPKYEEKKEKNNKKYYYKKYWWVILFKAKLEKNCLRL